jgi:hypothetical protein
MLSIAGEFTNSMKQEEEEEEEEEGSATRNLVEIVDSGTIEVVEVNKPR